MDVIGHRGCAAEFPENTLAAVRGAAPRVDLIEVDLRRCRSGELIVFHDERLDRLTDESGPVREFTYSELSTLTVGESEESIPTLIDVLEALPENTGLNIELKERGLHRETLDIVSKTPHDIVISSFDPSTLEPFRETPYPTAFLCMETERTVRTARELGCEYLHPEQSIVDADFVEHAHDSGLNVNAWTVPSVAAVDRLRGYGIDGVIVDSWTVVPSN